MNKKIIIGVIVIAVVGTGAYFLMGKNSKTVAAPFQTKVYHIGVVSEVPPFDTIFDSFKNKMTELGYVEGKNVVYDFHKTNNDQSATKIALQKFIDDKDDLIFAFPTEPAIAAKQITQGTTIPVVFSFGTVENTDLVDTIAQPGGNITGVRYPNPELITKRFEILSQMKPSMKRLYIAYNPAYPAIKPALEKLRPAVAAAGIKLVEQQVSSVADLKTALDKFPTKGDVGIDAILIMPETTVQSPDGWAILQPFAAAHNLPIGGSLDFEATAGAVFSFVPTNDDSGALAAPLADKVLKGIPAGTIPVVTPEARLTINYVLAKKLGLTLSDSLLSTAGQIIRQ